MLRPFQLVAVIFCATISRAQKTDTLILHYPSDQYVLLRTDKQKLDSFLSKGWDRISILGHTDETDNEEYNLRLSQKRAGEVFSYFRSKNIPDSFLSCQYFGESMPAAGNESEEGKAINRRTVVIGHKFAKISLMPKVDPMKPVTSTLDNGFMITYRPGALPDYFADNLLSGSSMNFRVFTNTTQMRENGFYNNTTNGEVLSSVMIISFDNVKQCKLDSPVLMRVPVPYQTNCDIQKLKFFVAVWKNGQKIWEEQTQTVFQQRINGVNYACVWVYNFCGSVNFDFKIPECFDTDSIMVYTKANIKYLTAELKGLNSVYLPGKVNDSTQSILFLKNRLNTTAISFVLYNNSGKKYLRSFMDEPLSSFPYDEAAKQYVLTTHTQKFYFPDLKLWDVMLKVNKDRYRVYPEKNECEIIYLERSTEKLLVDFTVIDRKGNASVYKNQPLGSFRYDETRGAYVIDKDFLKLLNTKNKLASR